ncbi:MAG TPA: methyltransferase domain-containing protein [Edaphobacter sp.]|nr:methyltransferase domain-containing protein [Edaphobacter sp.]
MPSKVELYDIAYEDYTSDLYHQIRRDTYGNDLGLTSWVSPDEANQIPSWLKISEDSNILELGCGSGGYAIYIAERTGCRITGLDLNAQAIRNANRLARIRNMIPQVRFLRHDLTKKLPYDHNTFDAIFANDVLCHVPNRPILLSEIFRILKPGGRILYSDALVIAGHITQKEIEVRSTLGLYIFSTPGQNEALLAAAGFTKIKAIDTTAETARIASNWYNARKKRRQMLLEQEGEVDFARQQSLLAVAAKLAEERRLLRYVYVAQKPPS